MSGSDGGSSGFGLGGGSGVVCSELKFEDFISNPKPNVISKLKVGDVLQLSLAGPDAYAVILSYSGQPAGVLNKYSGTIATCIKQGCIYIAHVRRIEGAIVTIWVECQGDC
jgi:hypothetical protein